MLKIHNDKCIFFPTYLQGGLRIGVLGFFHLRLPLLSILELNAGPMNCKVNAHSTDRARKVMNDGVKH